MAPRFKWRQQYDGSEEAVGDSCAIANNGPVLTEQHHKDDADINVLVARYGIHDHDMPTPLPGDESKVVDLTNVPDFRAAMDAVHRANEMFMELPAHVRERFGNQPRKFVQFLEDDKNFSEACKLGLAVKREIPEDAPTRVVVTNPAPEPVPPK